MHSVSSQTETFTDVSDRMTKLKDELKELQDSLGKKAFIPENISNDTQMKALTSFTKERFSCVYSFLNVEEDLQTGNFYLLPKEQYGFREGHRTTDQVLYFSQSIRDAQNKRHTNHTVAVFLDLTKTFDRVWNQKLIIKLYEVFEISGRALTWIYAFLRNSLIRVNFNNSLSRNFKLSQGVPQGSVLGLILCSLFLSGIEQVTNGRRDTGSFADDIVLWRTGTDLKKLESDVNQAFVDLWNFAEDHKLSFNPSKPTVGFFTANRKLYNFHPNILLSHQPLAVNKHSKYLGFVLDREILSNKHIDHLVLRARRRLNILKVRISDILLCLRHKLERVQLSSARIITCLWNSCSKDIVLDEANLQPLSLRRIPNLVKYYKKLYSLDSRNRTSAYLKDWCNNQRLKRNSPFSQVTSCNLITNTVGQYHLRQSIDPSVDLPGVFFHTNLPVHVNKQKDHPTYLRKLALEIINHIPVDAVKVYTGGSRNDSD
ncbi:putative RNA-directed DNA polymerase from transposon BS [Araneus ventricosus]|uniref:Putative RNA-directed DNA polymerase from transposon BS n=1 Tax=Araneus ventricosus TaxID=182803 RepID=A0A4Y2X7A9_ARAVE|nr:putative RNA-directed DNA polymerase from transposon BS [Araneus ventricosus]